MNRVRILTAWAGSGTALDPYRPAVADDHPPHAWSDTTGADPRGGGTFTVEIQCDDATLQQINSDPRYLGKVTVLQHGS